MTHAAPTTPNTAPDLPEDFSDFAALLEEYEANHSPKEGEIVTGTVIELTKDYVTIDIGYKSEGQIAVEEFVGPDGQVSVADGVCCGNSCRRPKSLANFKQGRQNLSVGCKKGCTSRTSSAGRSAKVLSGPGDVSGEKQRVHNSITEQNSFL